MNPKTLSALYADEQTRQALVMDDLRAKIATAERRINDIVAELHRDTGLIIDVSMAAGTYHEPGSYGDYAMSARAGFVKAQTFQPVYQVMARVTA